MVWCGVVWCGVVWCGVVLHGVLHRAITHATAWDLRFLTVTVKTSWMAALASAEPVGHVVVVVVVFVVDFCISFGRHGTSDESFISFQTWIL